MASHPVLRRNSIGGWIGSFRRRFLLDSGADRLGTIGYEVVCGISGRVDRRYTES